MDAFEDLAKLVKLNQRSEISKVGSAITGSGFQKGGCAIRAQKFTKAARLIRAFPRVCEETKQLKDLCAEAA